MKVKKPTPAEIAVVPPLSRQKRVRGARACNLCGEPAAAGKLRLYRECTAYDLAIPGELALLFVAGDHPACMERLDTHPRLYLEEQGRPGTFPKLCGGCVHREGFACTHPQAKINGGKGITFHLDPIAAMVVCIRGAGGAKPLAHVLDCEGQELVGEREAAKETAPREDNTTRQGDFDARDTAVQNREAVGQHETPAGAFRAPHQEP